VTGKESESQQLSEGGVFVIGLVIKKMHDKLILKCQKILKQKIPHVHPCIVCPHKKFRERKHFILPA
jgi:hypothetical protein